MDTWQVCTGDHVGDVAFRRTGVAAEPMSCIADAFRTGDRLVRLEPGASHEVTWERRCSEASSAVSTPRGSTRRPHRLGSTRAPRVGENGARGRRGES